uniref:Tetratricopeptide repeat-containing protein n=1 Tax=Toxoplasma gondii COUG TaxID=1074873 RepID=A0A2G8XPH9_TOXGO|nr:tetratricopeptide repeat-containing protein [Toxoplasma gondii COUG]
MLAGFRVGQILLVDSHIARWTFVRRPREVDLGPLLGRQTACDDGGGLVRWTTGEMATASMTPDGDNGPRRRRDTLSSIPIDRESERDAVVSLLQAAFCKGPRDVSAGLGKAVGGTTGGQLLKEEAGNPADFGSLLPAFKDDLGRTALHYACLGRRPVNAEWILKACPTIVDYKDSTGETALMIACRAGDVLLVNLLLNFGADVKKRSQTGITALHLAAESGDESCVTAVLDAGAEVNCFAEASGSPLQYAVTNKHYGAAELLLQKGADPNYPFNEKRLHLSVFPPPLLLACNARQDCIAELLLNYKANPNIRDKHNWTALQCAAESGAYRATMALLEAGADPDVTTQGLTAFDLAMQNQNWAVADLLKDRTALITDQGKIFTALQEARKKRCEMNALEADKQKKAGERVVGTAAQQHLSDAMKAKADADAFNEAGDYALAVDKYTQALERIPANETTKEARAMLYASRSMMYISLGDLEAAEADAQQATELDPLWSKGYAAKARVYKAKNQSDEYTKQLYEACTREPVRDEELISELKHAITMSRRNQTKQDQAPPSVVEING